MSDKTTTDRITISIMSKAKSSPREVIHRYVEIDEQCYEVKQRFAVYTANGCCIDHFETRAQAIQYIQSMGIVKSWK